MLTVQPKLLNNYYPAFKANEDYDEEIISLADMDEDTYESTREELEDQRDDFEDLASSKDFQIPKPAKKILTGGAVVTTGLLGGMAAGWGTKKSIEGFTKLAKTPTVRSLRKYVADTNDFVKTTSKTVKKQFLESNVYKKPANAISKRYEKFGKTKFGKPIVETLNAIGNGIKSLFKDIRNAYDDLKRDIKGIKKEKVEKVAVNTVGVSGGVSSGVMAVKEKSEAGED